MTTYSPRPGDIQKDWILIDAKGIVLGRLASIVASRLRGKHKAQFAPHMDTGDNIIIVNAEKIHLTGRKREKKTYYRHTGYPGGIRSTKAGEILKGQFPERVVTKAVKRMLPNNKLSRRLMTNLRVYAGSTHPHAAQKPRVLDIASINKKNTRSAQR